MFATATEMLDRPGGLAVSDVTGDGTDDLVVAAAGAWHVAIADFTRDGVRVSGRLDLCEF